MWAKANKRLKTFISYSDCVKSLNRSFQGMRLSEIHQFLIEKHKRMRIEEKAPVSANRELATLKALFNRCVEWNKYEGANPVKKVKLLKEPLTRVRYLEPDEEKRLLEATEDSLGTIILCGIHAGLRIQAEALSLKKVDVDLRRNLLTVLAAYAKSCDTETVPLNSILREALERQIARTHGEYVFTKRNGSPYRSIKTAFDNACKRANLEGVTPHTLRHTFASRLAMSGVDLRTIQELGRWKELKKVERYAHLSPSHKAEAVERIAQNFTPVFTPPKVVEISGRRLTTGK